MMGRREFALTGVSAATLAALSPLAKGAQATHEGHASGEHRGYSDAFQKCAEACSDCQRECSSCATHCASMLAGGMKDHQRTLKTCQDCADFCVAAAQIVARGGPFASLICESCAEACQRCGEACEKFSDDKRMQACADECKKCEKACREMVQSDRQASGG